MTRKSDISAENKKVNNIKNNLVEQLNKILHQTNQGSIKTRYRYYFGVIRFCGFLAGRFKIQKFENVKAKHLYAYVDYMKNEGISPSTIMTDLSGIRYFHQRTESKNNLPDNSNFKINKRKIGKLDRAWSVQEINKSISLAENMGRTDVSLAIKIASTFGMRLEETCKCQVNHLKDAINTNDLYIKGKNGQVRYVHLITSEQTALIKELLEYAKANKRFGTDRILFDSIKGATQKEKKSIQNWIYNHREQFEDNLRKRNEELKKLEEAAKKKGVKLKVKNITMHGLRHYWADQTYKYCRTHGFAEKKARKYVSEQLGHHRLAITKIYLSDIF